MPTTQGVYGRREQELPSSSFPTFALAFLTLAFYLSFSARIIIAPLLPAIETDLSLTHGGAGSLFLLISVGHSVMLVLSGFVSARLAHKRIVLFSLIGAGISLMLVSLSTSVVGLRFGLVLVGLATGLYLPSAISIITDMVQSERWGRAVGVHELATNLAYFSAPILVEGLIGVLDWRGVLGVLGVASVLVGSSFLFFAPGGFRGEAPNLNVLVPILKRPILWGMILVFAIGIGANFGLYSILPIYLVSARGMEREAANTLVSFSRPLGLVAVLVIGTLADRFGHWRTLSMILAATGCATVLLGVVPPSFLVVPLFLEPVLAAAFFPPALSALSGLASKQMRNLLVALIMSSGILLGTGVVPVVIGVLGDHGLFSTGIVLLGVISVGCGFFLLRTRTIPRLAD